MPAQLSAYKIPSACEYFQQNAVPGFCCVPGTEACNAYYPPGEGASCRRQLAGKGGNMYPAGFPVADRCVPARILMPLGSRR